jgi:hypothetical protein
MFPSSHGHGSEFRRRLNWGPAELGTGLNWGQVRCGLPEIRSVLLRSPSALLSASVLTPVLSSLSCVEGDTQNFGDSSDVGAIGSRCNSMPRFCLLLLYLTCPFSVQRTRPHHSGRSWSPTHRLTHARIAHAASISSPIKALFLIAIRLPP